MSITSMLLFAVATMYLSYTYVLNFISLSFIFLFFRLILCSSSSSASSSSSCSVMLLNSEYLFKISLYLLFVL